VPVDEVRPAAVEAIAETFGLELVAAPSAPMGVELRSAASRPGSA
jgi:hypothetical protein